MNIFNGLLQGLRKQLKLLSLTLIVVAGLFVQVQARAEWISGVPVYHYGNDNICSLGYHSITGEVTSYYRAANGSPKVGEIYYASVYVQLVSPCNTAGVVMGLNLPANTVTAVDANNPIQCYWTSGGTTTLVTGNTTNYRCPTSVAASAFGGYDMGRANLYNQNERFEVVIPVRSTAPLSAQNFTGYVTAGTYNITGTLSPTVPAFVYANNTPPSVSYPATATTSITNTTATSYANLTANYTAGTLYFDLGPTTSYGTSESVAVPNTYDTVQANSNWVALIPGTTYHWRARFVTSGGTYSGADMTFITTGTAPVPQSSYILNITEPLSGGTVSASPQGSNVTVSTTSATRTTTRTYASGTAVALTPAPISGYSFTGWTVDTAAGGSSTPLNVTMGANHNVTASFPATSSISVPGAPVIGVATPGNGQASIAFTAPANTGGAPINSYNATCGTKNANGSSSPIVITGLTNGTSYTCTVTASNSVGTSAASASVSVTPLASASNSTVPGAPVLLKATSGNMQISVAFDAPASDGGATITTYTATCGSQSATGTSSPLVVFGLANGTAYTCSVTATNAAGISAASATVSSTPTPTGAVETVPAAAGGSGKGGCSIASGNDSSLDPSLPAILLLAGMYVLRQRRINARMKGDLS